MQKRAELAACVVESCCHPIDVVRSCCYDDDVGSMMPGEVPHLLLDVPTGSARRAVDDQLNRTLHYLHLPLYNGPKLTISEYVGDLNK